MQIPIATDEYIALRASVGWESPSPATVQKAFESTKAWAVERDEHGALIGLARAVGDGIYLLIVDVMVHPDHQGQGLGRALMLTLMKDAAVVGARHTTLFAASDVAPFYRALGFEEQTGCYFRYAAN